MDDLGMRRERLDARVESSETLMHKQEFSVEEIAELFQISAYVIREAVFHHELPAARAGQNILGIKRDDLLAWLERRGGV